ASYAATRESVLTVRRSCAGGFGGRRCFVGSSPDCGLEGLGGEERLGAEGPNGRRILRGYLGGRPMHQRCGRTGGNQMAELLRTNDPFLHWKTLLRDPFELATDLGIWQPVQQLERAFTPTFEVRESVDAFVIKADMPGI